jgi:hypothetical protein
MTRTNRRRLPAALAAATLLAGAAGAGVYWRGQRSTARGAGDVADDAMAEAAPTDGPARHGCRFRLGETLGYALDIDANAQVHPQLAGLGAGAGSAPVSVRKQVRAELQLEALSSDAGQGAVLLASYRHANVGAGAGVGAAELATPFLIRVDPSCHLSGFARFEKTPAAAARTQQALVHELTWRWPQRGQAVEEPDQNGVGAYVARHALVNGPSGPRVERTVLSYTALWSAGLAPNGAAPVMPAIPRSSALVVEPGRGPWFESLRGEETLAGLSATDSHTVSSARRIPPEAGALDGAPTDQGRYVWENLLPRSIIARAVPEVTARDLRQRDAVRGLSLDQALGSFVAGVRSGKNFSETWPELKVYLEARPEMAGETMRRLRANQVPEEAEAAAFLAMGKAQTPEAREALLQTMRDTSAEVIDRSRSVFALVDRPDVGAPLARELSRNAMGVASGGSRAQRIFARESALAVGMMAGLRGDTETEIKTVALQAVPGLLAQGNTATLLSPAFGTIANIGDPATLSLVRPYTESADPGVRAVAARSIRRMSPQETGDFAAGWLARETDASVKRELYGTIAKQAYDAQQPVTAGVVQRAIADLQSKPGLLTRKAIIKILGQQAATDPTAKTALMNQIAFETKENSGLYSVIAGYLSTDDISKAVGL